MCPSAKRIKNGLHELSTELNVSRDGVIHVES